MWHFLLQIFLSPSSLENKVQTSLSGVWGPQVVFHTHLSSPFVDTQRRILLKSYSPNHLPPFVHLMHSRSQNSSQDIQVQLAFLRVLSRQKYVRPPYSYTLYIWLKCSTCYNLIINSHCILSQETGKQLQQRTVPYFLCKIVLSSKYV